MKKRNPPDMAKGKAKKVVLQVEKRFKHPGKLKTRKAQQARALQVDSGRLPRGDIKSTGKTYFLDVYRWVGSDMEPEIRKVLELEEQTPGYVTTRVAIGTRYHRHGDWVGSPWETPRGTIRYLTVWRLRPSSENPVLWLKDDREIFWELEVLRPRTRKGQKFPKPKGRKRAKKSKAPKQAAIPSRNRKRNNNRSPPISSKRKRYPKSR